MDKDKAKKIEALKKCRDEYINRKDECTLITISWKRGDKSGIISRVLMDAILQQCADYTQGMIDKLEGREPKKFRVVVINDDYAANVYDEGGVKALNEYCQENYISSIDKEFDSEELMQAYLEGMFDIAGGDERAPATYLVITDEEELKKLEI